MIFQRALQRELTSTAGAVFATLFTITITVMLIKILGQAAGGKVASSDVVALIGFQALNYLPVILILTGFISVLLVVTRSYQDSEMVVWFASGMSLTRWVQPILGFGTPLIIATLVLSFFLTPWANRQSAQFQQRFKNREDLSRISPGKFQESRVADRIFFVENVQNDAAKIKNVFVNTLVNGRTGIVVAREGTVDINDKGDKYVIMEKGRRYEGIPQQPDFKIMEFDRYGVLVSRNAPSAMGETSARALPSFDLLVDDSNVNMGELLWRLALPIMATLLMLLAIPPGFANPRVGRSAGLIVALLLFVTYSNMVSFFQATVVQNRMQFHSAWWPVHLVVACIVVGLFFWRLNVNSPYHPVAVWSRLKRRRPEKAGA